MTTNIVCYMKSYIQPFEKVLALKELEACAGAYPVMREMSDEKEDVYLVTTTKSLDHLAERLTYWERIKLEGNETDETITLQVRREATTHLVRNGIKPSEIEEVLPFEEDIVLPNRRNLRYGSHGIHEYRGKFFPQLVRSLLNISSVTSTSIVLDPMCGSGTTPAEAVLLGSQAIGIDLNPLSVLISQAKSAILHVQPEILTREYENLKTDVLGTRPSSKKKKLEWFQSLPTKDQNYLSRWFAPDVLRELDPIAVRVHKTQNLECRLLFVVCLSNILRSISWQKDDDLRVRKDIRSDFDFDVVAEFLAELNRSVRTVLALLHENHGFKVGCAQIIEGDARESADILKDRLGQIDVIVTSPPYATALPYLDTDRLSLSYLNLLTRPEHRQRDYSMIGNREINNGRREKYWTEFQQEMRRLPGSIVDVISRIHDLNLDAGVGFRRKNLPSLLARYFFDMEMVLRGFRVLLRENAAAYVVVGNNYTVAGGHRIDIETDKLLAELGESVGLKLEEIIPMEMLVSRDIFKKNTGSSESILFFRND